MGNRYGRNQKRKARAALAEAAAREAGLRKLYNYKKDELALHQRVDRHKEQALRDVQEILGAAFIAFEPPTVQASGQWRPEFDIQEHPSFEGYAYEGIGSLVHDVRLKIHRLRGVKFDVLREHLRRCIHYRVSYRDAKIGYYVSDEAVEDRSIPSHLLEQNILRELAHAFTGELEKFRHDGQK